MYYEEAAEIIIKVCRLLYEKNFVAANDGNVSARLSDGSILATPTCLNKGEVRKEDLVLLDADGNELSEGRHASSEIKMHLCVYKERPDVCGVVHSHAPAATAFSCAGKNFDCTPFSAAVMNFGRQVPLSDFAISGTNEVPESIKPHVPDNNAILLANHGLLTFAKDVFTAYQLTETFENICETAIRLKTIGEVTPIPEWGITALENKFHK